MAPHRILSFLVTAAVGVAADSSPSDAADGALLQKKQHAFLRVDNLNDRAAVASMNASPGARIASDAYGKLFLTKKELRRHRRGGRETANPPQKDIIMPSRRLEFSGGSKGESKDTAEADEEHDDLSFWMSLSLSYPPAPTPSPPAPTPAPTPSPTGTARPPVPYYVTEIACDGTDADGRRSSSDVGDDGSSDEDGEREYDIDFEYGIETEHGDGLCPETLPHLEYLMMRSVADALLDCDDDDEDDEDDAGSSISDDVARDRALTTVENSEQESSFFGERSRRRAKEEQGRIVGVFSTPEDTPSADLECRPSEDKATQCFPTDGKMRVRVVGDGAFVERAVHRVLQWNMDRNWYVDDLNDEGACGRSKVVHINYVVPDDVVNREGDSTGQMPPVMPAAARAESALRSADGAAGLTGNQKLGIMGASFLVLLALCAFCCFHRRCRGEEDDLDAKLVNDDDDGTVIAHFLDGDNEPVDRGGDLDSVATGAAVAGGGAAVGASAGRSRADGGGYHHPPDYSNLGARHTAIDTHSCKSATCELCNPLKNTNQVTIAPDDDTAIERAALIDDAETVSSSTSSSTSSRQEVQFVRIAEKP